MTKEEDRGRGGERKGERGRERREGGLVYVGEKERERERGRKDDEKG